jgi:hypothetical protein
MVLVTGQVVTVSYVTTVVTAPSGPDFEPTAVLDGAGVSAGGFPVVSGESGVSEVLGMPGVLPGVLITGVDVDTGATDDGGVAGKVSVSVTGPTLVETGTVVVTTVVEPAGQLTTGGAQLVTVISFVEYTVEVVRRTGEEEVVLGVDVPTGPDEDG